MSGYSLLKEARPVARKAHRCIWCGQSIPAGAKYLFQAITWEGSVHNQHWHFECADAQQEEGRQSGEWEFSPYDNERPAAADLVATVGGEGVIPGHPLPPAKVQAYAETNGVPPADGAEGRKP